MRLKIRRGNRKEVRYMVITGFGYEAIWGQIINQQCLTDNAFCWNTISLQSKPQGFGPWWLRNFKNEHSQVIPNGITVIMMTAFDFCSDIIISNFENSEYIRITLIAIGLHIYLFQSFSASTLNKNCNFTKKRWIKKSKIILVKIRAICN